MTEGALVLWIVLLTIVLQVLVKVSCILHRYVLEWSSPQAVQAKRRKMFPEAYKTPLEQLKRWGRLEHSNEMNLPCSNPTCQHCYPQKQAIKTTGKAAYIPHVYEVGTMAQERPTLVNELHTAAGQVFKNGRYEWSDGAVTKVLHEHNWYLFRHGIPGGEWVEQRVSYVVLQEFDPVAVVRRIIDRLRWALEDKLKEKKELTFDSLFESAAMGQSAAAARQQVVELEAQMRTMTAVPTPILGRGITYEPCPPTPAEHITY